MLAAALFATRTCASTERNIDGDEAVELAREAAGFEPCAERRCRQRRFLQRGIPPRPYWGVVLARDLDADGRPTRTQSFLVDAQTGDVQRVG